MEPQTATAKRTRRTTTETFLVDGLRISTTLPHVATYDVDEFTTSTTELPDGTTHRSVSFHGYYVSEGGHRTAIRAFAQTVNPTDRDAWNTLHDAAFGAAVTA